MLLFKNILLLVFLFLITQESLQAAAPWAPSHQFPALTGSNINIGTDADGNAIAVWDDSSSLPNVVMASYFTNGAWGPSMTISNPANTSNGSQVAMNDNGTALAIWVNQTTSALESAVFNGATWGIPTVLFNNNLPSNPAIALDATGKGAAIWIDSASDIYTSLYNGSSWGPSVLVGNTGSNMGIAISPTGTALGIWSDLTNIYSTFYNGTIWEPSTIISTGILNTLPVIGMAATGTGLALWTDAANILAASFNGLNWEAPVIISTGAANFVPEIAVQPNGLATAIWSGSAETTIQSASFNGTAWSAPTPVTTNTPSQRPVISMDGNGNAMAIWAYASANNEVQSALLRAGQNIWDAPLTVYSTPNDIVGTGIAFSSLERAFAVWTTLIDEEDNVTFGSFLDALIPPAGFIGITCTDRFGWQKDCVHILNWNSPAPNTVVSFLLRRNDILIAQLPATGPYTYVDHNRCRQTDIYTLASVDIFGIESLPASVTLK